MFSRAGKSTNNLYLAFQDKDKLKSVQSKVAAFLGKENDQDKDKEQISQIDQIRNMMSIEENNEPDKKGGGKRASIDGDIAAPINMQGAQNKERDLHAAK